MHKSNPRIVVVGELYQHWRAHVSQFPGSGETLRAGQVSSEPGGRGAVQALAAAHLGAAVRLIAPVGQDPLGDSLRHTLARHGVELHGLVSDNPAATGVGFTWLSAHAQFRAVLPPGPHPHHSWDRFIQAHLPIGPSDFVILTSGIPWRAVATIAGLARERGAKVILDPDAEMAEAIALIPAVDYLVLSEDTLALLTRAPLSDFSRPLAAIKARELRKPGVHAVMVRLGPLGALLVREDLEHLWRPHPGAKGDTTHAGDLFTASFAAALALGKTELSAGKLAVIVATARLWLPGHAPHFPSWPEPPKTP
jgi:ribokinase